MPLDGLGTYEPPSPENPVRAGNLIKSAEFNTTIDDIADALSTALYRDGQAVMEADLNINHNMLNNVERVQNTSTLHLSSSEGGLDLTAADRAIITANEVQILSDEEITLGNSTNIQGDVIAENATLDSIKLKDGQVIEYHTDIGGEGQAGKSIITNENGVISNTLLMYTPSPESTSKFYAGAALQAGDFIYIDDNLQVMPCDANTDALAVGFVLESVGAGALVDVYFAGYNNRVHLTDTRIDVNRFVYIGAEANEVCYNPLYKRQVVGVLIGDGLIRFLATPPTPQNNHKLLYYSNI